MPEPPPPSYSEAQQLGSDVKNSRIDCPCCRANIQLATPKGGVPSVTGYIASTETFLPPPPFGSSDPKSEGAKFNIFCSHCRASIELTTPYDGVPAISGYTSPGYAPQPQYNASQTPYPTTGYDYNAPQMSGQGANYNPTQTVTTQLTQGGGAVIAPVS